MNGEQRPNVQALVIFSFYLKSTNLHINYSITSSIRKDHHYRILVNSISLKFLNYLRSS